jgi:hypothetical protein
MAPTFDPNTVPNNPLAGLEDQIKEHWETFRPSMTAEMKQDGSFETSVKEAAEKTRQAVLNYVQAHSSNPGGSAAALYEGWELFREEWAFLASEEDDEDEDIEKDDEDDEQSEYFPDENEPKLF